MFRLRHEKDFAMTVFCAIANVIIDTLDGLLKRGKFAAMAEGTNEHLRSSVVSAARAKRCVTHYYGCDCREYRFERMREALIRIMVWAEQDAISSESRQKAMADIARACHEGLEQ